MAHTSRDKDKLLMRVRRIRGQVEAIERALVEEKDCGALLQLIAAARGAMGSLMAEVVEGHVRSHLVDPDKRSDTPRARAAAELIEVLKTYLK